MNSLLDGRATITTRRVVTLFCLFFLIDFGLGYPILNRYDPRQTPGLVDVRGYAALVTGATSLDQEYLHFRQFRVLVPWVARPFYHLALGRSGSWDPVMFGLLTADSLFVAATAALLVVFGTRKLGSYVVAFVAALLYQLNFAVANLRVVGLVDAGEGFFLLVLLWSLADRRLWMLPLVGVLGSLAKESFIPLCIVWTAAWWWVAGKKQAGRVPWAVWILSSWAACFATLILMQWRMVGHFVNPLEFVSTLEGSHGYTYFRSLVRDRNLWFIFAWLLPMALPNLKRLPKSWLIPVGTACAMALALDVYHGVEGGAVFRTWFSVAGPLLSLSAAMLLLGSPVGCVENTVETRE